MKSLQITILILLILCFSNQTFAQNNDESNDPPSGQTSNNCHYTCSSCINSSPTGCLECSDESRGYNGVPGYKSSCYCLDNEYESFKSKCNTYDSEYQTLDVIIAIGLWIILPISLVVSAFGNQFMGFYCIDTIQIISYYYYVSQMFPSTINNPLYYMRYYSLSNFNTLMRSSFLKDYQISENEFRKYVIIDQQVVGDPKYTYYEIPSNFIYNGTIHIIAISIIYFIFGLFLLYHAKYPQKKLSFISSIYNARKSILFRVYQFFVGDLFFFSALQCTNIIFTTPMGSMGFIIAVMVFLLIWVGFAYGFYMINMNKIKFEDKQNQIFFNRLKSNDKINRNFFFLQIANKVTVTLFMNIFMNTSDLQISAVSIISLLFITITIFKIKLKKRRHQIFLYLTNICKIIVNIFMLMFRYSDSQNKLTAGWLFEVSLFILFVVMIIYLIIELTSQLPDIIMFIKQINCLNCFRNKSNSMISLEMQQCNYLSQTKTIPNKVYSYFESEDVYEKAVNKYLDEYQFDMPEEDDDQNQGNQDGENPENVDIPLDEENNEQNNQEEQDLQNEFDPEEYLKQANN